MKTRLYGLLALVLCAMMVAAPVAAMGAAQYEVLSSNSNSNIAVGDIVYSLSGIPFTLTSNPFEMKYTYLDSTPYSQTASGIFPGTGNNPWQIVSVGTEAASLAQVKVLFKEQLAANANQALNITAYLIGTELGSQYPSAEAAKASLKDALRGYKNIDYYYMKVYECLHDGGDGEIYRPIPDPGETLITLPYPSSYSEATPKSEDFCLAHLKGDGTVELISASALTDEGIQFKVSSFSPFALGYQRNDAGTNPDGGTIIPGGPGDRIPAPADPVAPSTPSIPQTGDNSQLALWFALAALSLAGAVLTLRRRKA